MCGRENVVPGKARKPRSHSHQILPATSYPYIQSLHQISTLSPSPLLHYEDFKYVEGLYISVCERRKCGPLEIQEAATRFSPKFVSS